MKCFILTLSVLASAAALQYTTPVPILKQINKHNEDGSYSYGYESADGSYRIESKYPNGEIYGKYGYKDNTGKLRETEYGATKRGFEPQGNDINVPPPTLNDDKNPIRPLSPNEEDDGQYREDPSIYYKDEKYNQNTAQQPASPKGNQQSFQQFQYQPQPQYEQQPSKFNFDEFINAPFKFNNQQKYQPLYQTQYQSQNQPQYQSLYQPQYQPLYQQQYQTTQAPINYYAQPSGYNPQNNYYNQLQGVPASNVNLELGSYTINYK